MKILYETISRPRDAETLKQRKLTSDVARLAAKCFRDLATETLCTLDGALGPSQTEINIGPPPSI